MWIIFNDESLEINVIPCSACSRFNTSVIIQRAFHEFDIFCCVFFIFSCFCLSILAYCDKVCHMRWLSMAVFPSLIFFLNRSCLHDLLAQCGAVFWRTLVHALVIRYQIQLLFSSDSHVPASHFFFLITALFLCLCCIIHNADHAWFFVTNSVVNSDSRRWWDVLLNQSYFQWIPFVTTLYHMQFVFITRCMRHIHAVA